MKDWKDIEGMEGRYQMSGDGSIRVLSHFVRGRKVPMKILDLKYQEVVAIKKRLE
ncbi:MULTISPECIES: NUMOD4 domain-containing protein [unclassified Lactonifactor]|uniref:NUMOD4 domain-containing protein n=1 Tax=unclassified Lactonifactor TaxID=2636670 RepID=UPI001FA9C15A|nr:MULTISPECIES: NUMOD4 domain-containing protein [unclassified Lactonifactor]